MTDERTSYDDVISYAENGEPHCILQLANLYRMGVFGENMYDEYIFYLRSFFESPTIQSIILTLADKTEDHDDDSSTGDEPTFDYAAVYADIPGDYELVLLSDIVEAGMALGLYYRYSTQKDELILSRDSLIAAMDASRGDNLKYIEKDGTITDILSIFRSVMERITELGYGDGHE